MKLIFSLVAVAVSIVLVGGCSSASKAGYYWGDYSQTYLTLTRKPSAQATQAHIKELRDILQVSQEKELKPPPGICAELAFYLSQPEGEGSQEEIDRYYQCEIETYPESALFIQRLTGVSQ